VSGQRRNAIFSTERDDSFGEELARKIDDKDPAHWLDLEELRKKVAE
jgi:hypothetical protein